jgi:hypothetical protein
MTRLSEAKMDLYTIRTDTSSATVVMASVCWHRLMRLWFVLIGAIPMCSVLYGLTSPEDRPQLLYNWPGTLLIFFASLLFVLVGGLDIRWLIDLRSIKVTPGRVTVAWRLFRTRIRSLSFNVQLVAVHQDMWRDGAGSTDRVVLQGKDQTYTVTEVWNMPPVGSFKPPFNDWPLGAASEPFAHGAGIDERTVSPLMLELAKALASAASVPMILRARETRRPWFSIGGD